LEQYLKSVAVNRLMIQSSHSRWIL